MDKLILLPEGRLVYAVEQSIEPERLQEWSRTFGDALQKGRLVIFDSVEVIDARTDSTQLTSVVLSVPKPENGISVAAVKKALAGKKRG